jgi:hypothetical protein
MTLDGAGQPQYIGERKAAISAWFAEDLELTTTLDLCPRPA